MFALDLFNTDHERRLAEGAVDRLEQRRIDDLAMRMDDLVARARKADTPEAKAALIKEFQKCKDERDGYFKIKDECMGYGGIVGEDVSRLQAEQRPKKNKWMAEIKAKYPNIRFSEEKMPGGAIVAYLPGQRDPVAVYPRQAPFGRVGGLKEFTQAPEVADQATDRPAAGGYSVVLQGKPGKPGGHLYTARNAWAALMNIFPDAYPTLDSAGYKTAEVAERGSAMVKSGLDKNTAQNAVAKLSKWVPAQFWRVIGTGLDEAGLPDIADKKDKMARLNQPGRVGTDIVSPQQRVAGATPPSNTMLGKAKETFASFANWLAGRDDTGPTYESAVNEQTGAISPVNAAKYAYEQMRKAHDDNVDIATIRWMSNPEPITMSRNQLYHTLTKLKSMSRQNRNQFALQTLANRQNFALWLGSQNKVQPRPKLKQPADPFQTELPLNKPQVSPVQERAQKKNSDREQYGDTEVARSVQKIRAKHPAARSDVEALAKDELENAKRSEQQLAAIKGANTEQDALLRQLVALDKKQGQDIDQLDSENNRQERELQRIQATNANLQKTIQDMTGTKQSARPKQTARAKPQTKTAEPIPAVEPTADPKIEKKMQELEAKIGELEQQPPSADVNNQIKKLQTRINSLAPAIAQATGGSNEFNLAGVTKSKKAPKVSIPIGDLDIEPLKQITKSKPKAKAKAKAVPAPGADDEFDVLGLDPAELAAVDEGQSDQATAHAVYIDNQLWRVYANAKTALDMEKKVKASLKAQGRDQQVRVSPYYQGVSEEIDENFGRAGSVPSLRAGMVARHGLLGPVTVMKVAHNSAFVKDQTGHEARVGLGTLVPLRDQTPLKRQAVGEGTQRLHPGDPIVVTAPNEFEGATGEIHELSPSGKFVIVNLYNHGKHSMHLSDVEYNEYADDEDDGNVNDIDDGPQHAYDSDERTRSDQFEGFQDFNKVEPYEVCLAGKCVKTFDYYEDARRFHDNWKKKLYREGNKAKADKITLNPVMKEQGVAEGEGGLGQVAGIGINGKQFNFSIKDLIAKAQNYPIKKLNPQLFVKQLADRHEDPKQTAARAQAADLQYPIIVVQDGNTLMIADGTHRAQKAIMNKLPSINAYVIPVEDMAEFSKQGVAEDTGSWIVYDPETKQIKKRFKTHTAGKSYAQTHKLGFASSEYYFDQVKEKTVAENDDWDDGEWTDDPSQHVVVKSQQPTRYPESVLRAIQQNPAMRADIIRDYKRKQQSGSLNELSNEKLAQYKQAAALDAGAADRAGDFERGDKRFAGIVKATKKQFANDVKKHKEVDEAQTDYQKRRQRERDVDAGRPVKPEPKNPQTDWAKKRAKEKRDLEQFGEEFTNQSLRQNIPGKSVIEGFTVVYDRTTKKVNIMYQGEVLDSFKYTGGPAFGQFRIALEHKLRQLQKDGKGPGRVKVAPNRDYDQTYASGLSHNVDLPLDVQKQMYQQHDQDTKDYGITSVANPGKWAAIRRAQAAKRDKEAVAEENSTSSDAVERAILNRIMVAHTDLLMKFDPEKVMQAAEEVAYNVGDIYEIGRSDVNAYVDQVRQILGAE